MEPKTRARPTLLQSNFSTAILVTISILLIPFTLLVTIIASTVSTLNGTAINRSRTAASHTTLCKTVLITGGRANKALTLLRAFKREGHRVILAEEAKWGTFTCARFSRATDAYYPLPDPLIEPCAYSRAIQEIVVRERVDVWVPCSSVHATMVDAEVAKAIRESGLGGPSGCDCFIPEPEISGSLHWKDQFEELCKELHYPVPDSKTVTNVADAVEFLHSPETIAKGFRYLLKSLSLDDLGRDDFTLFPLSSREATFAHLSHVPTPISEEHPFLLQRFLHGQEYCTHVAARDGQLVAFVACPSNPLLMRYCDVRTLRVGRGRAGELEQWSQRFLDLCKLKLESEGKTERQYELTGHFSFDFIIEESEKEIYVLECNVRPHTAVCLFADHPTLASHYLGTKTDSPSVYAVARPPGSPAPRSWIAHAFPLTLAGLLPRSCLRLIHPQLESTIHPPSGTSDPTMFPQPSGGPLSLIWSYLHGDERDGIWDWTDPVPFLVFCHIQWSWLLLRLFWRGVAWSRVNVSTSRVFEC